ncbi:glutamine synthetase beta-grasp domain-containing protein, partial [Planctomycetota bacterium]
MFAAVKDVFEYIRNRGMEQIELKVVDLQGRWRRMTYSAATVTERLFHEGTGISLSPYPGYRTVDQGDMKVRPDVSTGFLDPFHARPTLAFICDMLDNDGNRYPKDPRYVCQKAEQYLASLNLGGQALFMPELEFYLLDGASYRTSPGESYFSVEAHGLGWGEDDDPVYRVSGFEKIGQADAPLDRHTEARELMVKRIEEAGIKVKYHHHELGTPGQVEVELMFDTPVRTADA